jgi:alginate O-acetyltransferase complex protein AlgJ
LLPVALLAACASSPELSPAEPGPELRESEPGISLESMQAALRRRVVEAEQQQRRVLEGRDGWLFFVPELRSLTVGAFWGEAAARVSRATDPKTADPLPCILDFTRQLQSADIQLLFVPVPAKASVYPEMLPLDPPLTTTPRLDVAQQDFYHLLEEHAVTVVDLLPAFLAERDRQPEPLYCRQDTHWSPRGAQLAARLIAERVRKLVGPATSLDTHTVPGTVTIQGDLWRMLEPPRPEPESLSIRMVGRGEGVSFTPIRPSRDAPLLLLGDSHNLVFSAGGDLHATAAGLPEHLSRELGQPVDLVAVRGSGATPSRVSLLRRGDSLKGKKVVVWCLSVREFTESAGGWRPLQIMP